VSQKPALVNFSSEVHLPQIPVWKWEAVGSQLLIWRKLFVFMQEP